MCADRLEQQSAEHSTKATDFFDNSEPKWEILFCLSGNIMQTFFN